MSAIAQEFLSKLSAMPSNTNLCLFPDHSNIRDGFSVQLQEVESWGFSPAQPSSQPRGLSRHFSSENKKYKNINFVMVHRDDKPPEPSHASEFAAQTYFVWLAEASTSWRKTLLSKWFRERKTIWNCLQPALLRQYGSEFQFSVNKQPISECVSSFNVMSSNQHRLCSGNQKNILLHLWERRCFVPFY